MLRRLKALEAELTATKSQLDAERQTRKKLRLLIDQAQHEWERTFDAIEDYITILDTEKRILQMNRAVSVAFSKSAREAVGRHCYSALHGRPKVCRGCPTNLVLEDNRPHTVEYENRRLGKSYLISASPIFNDGAALIAIVLVTKDITGKKAAENALKAACDQMEHEVRRRTAQLDYKSRHLEEAITALRLMLKAREEDRHELGQKVISNARRLVLPYIEKLKGSSLSAAQFEWLRILSANVDEIISPFAATLSAGHISLTPREIQTANLVKNGKTNKEIAELLGVSLRAVEFHRENIRKKLGLKHKKTNLRSHLMSLH